MSNPGIKFNGDVYDLIDFDFAFAKIAIADDKYIGNINSFKSIFNTTKREWIGIQVNGGRIDLSKMSPDKYLITENGRYIPVFVPKHLLDVILVRRES